MPDTREVGGYRCNPSFPPEDPDEGCPGGWRESAYVASVAPYLRTRCEGGMRVSNPLLDRCEDEAVIQAVIYYEAQHERCIRHSETIEERARDG